MNERYHAAHRERYTGNSHTVTHTLAHSHTAQAAHRATRDCVRSRENRPLTLSLFRMRSIEVGALATMVRPISFTLPLECGVFCLSFSTRCRYRVVNCVAARVRACVWLFLLISNETIF